MVMHQVAKLDWSFRQIIKNELMEADACLLSGPHYQQWPLLDLLKDRKYIII